MSLRVPAQNPLMPAGPAARVSPSGTGAVLPGPIPDRSGLYYIHDWAVLGFRHWRGPVAQGPGPPESHLRRRLDCGVSERPRPRLLLGVLPASSQQQPRHRLMLSRMQCSPASLQCTSS
eukprot:405-Hanusia_phi.AAC.1